MARNRYMDDEAEAKKLNIGLLKRLLRYMFPYKKDFFLGLTLLILNVLVGLIWPRLVQWIIDDILMADAPHTNDIAYLLGGVGVVTLIIFLDIWVAARRVVIVSRLGHNTIHDIRKELFDHIQTLAFNYFDDRPAGKIMVRVTGYVDSLARLLSSQLIQLIVDVFTLACILVILFLLNWRLTLLCFIALVPLSVFIVFIRRLLARLARLVRAKASNRTAYIHENIMGVLVTQAFNREQQNADELVRLDKDVNHHFLHQHLAATSLGPAIDILSTVAKILVYFVAIGFIAQGQLTLGALTAFTTYTSRFWQPISNFVMVFGEFVEATGNIERIFETIDTESEIQDAPGAYDLPPITGQVEYKDVTFSYDGKINVLEHLSFTARPGEMIAFVGPTGAGKTTIVSLLSRFYDVTDGSITIDGHDIRNITVRSLRTQVSVMMQDSFIFSGTVMDNIRYGRPDATDEECIAAARKVYASEFIEAMPHGYQTKVEERGAGLSTGQRQLLSFARAVLADPRVLILDEATSSIDTQTEQMIQRALKQLLEGRTSFVIAHRLSTIKSADKIFCIADKGIAESGSHEELMAKKGIYYELNMSQYHALVNKS